MSTETSSDETFAQAWSAREPGPMTPPGPRQNQWTGPVGQLAGRQHHSVLPVARLADMLWRARGMHPDPATGRTGTIPRRAVPSAGACYPVQLHALCGEGCDLPPGIHAFQRDHVRAVQRSGGGLPASGAILVFTVLPQRTTAKYHHRAAPLLLADTAYAMMATAQCAAALGIEASWLAADHGSLAGFVGLPDYEQWQQVWPGSAPELALAAMALHPGPGTTLPAVRWEPASTGRGPIACPERRPRVVADIARWSRLLQRLPGCDVPLGGGATLSDEQLGHRRSLAPDPEHRVALGTRLLADEAVLPWNRQLQDFGVQAPPGCQVQELHRGELAASGLGAACAGQEWVEALDGMLLFTTDHPVDEIGMWWSALSAAQILYSSTASGHPVEFRPVGGWTGTWRGVRILHGLGYRKKNQEGNCIADQ